MIDFNKIGRDIGIPNPEDYIRKEIQELIQREERISWEEYCQLRLNSYERQVIYGNLSDEALVKTVKETFLPNVSNPSNYPPITYDETLIHVLVPILCKRILELCVFREITEKLIDSGAITMDTKEVDLFFNKMSYLEQSPEEFKNWLDSKPEGCILGQSNTATMCPIANYLLEKGYRNPHVSKFFTSTETGKVKENPVWVTEFIRRADDLGKNHPTDYFVYIRKEAAIEILEQVSNNESTTTAN